MEPWQKERTDLLFKTTFSKKGIFNPIFIAGYAGIIYATYFNTWWNVFFAPFVWLVVITIGLRAKLIKTEQRGGSDGRT